MTKKKESIPSEQKILRLEPIDEESIKFKIKKYLDNDHTLETMKVSLQRELYDFQWTALRCQMQAQAFQEQINFIDRQIAYRNKKQ